MTVRNRPTDVFHFTHVDHLVTMVQRGVLCDTAAQTARLLTTEVGNLDIKKRRRQCAVPHPPGGTVADYVPFYFAPRSPMMYAISRGNVPSYQGGTTRLVYLLSTLEVLHELEHRLVLTDRNAALDYADFRVFDPHDLIDDGFIDWDLMTARYWSNTPDDLQRRERRMAEALVHEQVTWNAITEVSAQNENVANEVRTILAGADSSVPVNVRPEWYF